MSTKKRNIVYGVGKHIKQELTMINIPDEYGEISDIYSGFGFTIYTANTFNICNTCNIWCVVENSLSTMIDDYWSDRRIEKYLYGESEEKSNESRELLIDYFFKRNINIQSISAGYSKHIFCISDQHIMYITGIHHNSINETTMLRVESIRELNNIIDAKCAAHCNVALCSMDNKFISMIIEHWFKSKILPNDIINLIIIFTKIYQVYIAEFAGFEWKEIDIFKNKNIIKIETGYFHCLFLEQNGILWSSGHNTLGQLGLNHDKNRWTPYPIQYFINNRIRIKQIKCGGFHSLAIDYNHWIYSWGSNKYGECGDIPTNPTKYPDLILSLMDKNIERIECGFRHSYCMSFDRKHYLFGKNFWNECITNDNREQVMVPHCINHVIASKCNDKTIKSVSLGTYNTKLIVV